MSPGGGQPLHLKCLNEFSELGIHIVLYQKTANAAHNAPAPHP